MTCEQIGDRFRLGFSEPEALFLAGILSRMAGHYRDDPAGLPPAQRAYWEGHIASDNRAARALAGSQELLAEARAELRGERAVLVENWLQALDLAETHQPWVLELDGAERDDFIAILNDRRLLLALDLGVGDEEMEMDLGQIVTEARRAAILEIDLLGHFILVALKPDSQAAA